MSLRSPLLAAVLLVAAALPVAAGPLRWARATDTVTLDPHARIDPAAQALEHQIYEPLVQRNAAGLLEPALARGWAVSAVDPEVWVFDLREGVRFQDGADFDAGDVVFSIDRAKSPGSAVKGVLSGVREVRVVSTSRIEIVTDGPDPLLPGRLTDVFILDEGWAKANNLGKVEEGKTSFATANTNGTGPYRLVSREPDARTVLALNEDYWAREQFPLEVSAIVFTPIKDPAARVAALLAGDVDFIQDVPVADLARIAGTVGLEVLTGPQNQVVFLGLNLGAADLSSDDVTGANPLADVRVRRAMNMVINREAIQQVVMSGQSRPAGVIIPPFANGWDAEMDLPPATDVTAAKALMAEAGYGGGFSIRLDCPNDRYLNDAAICQAVVGMMAQIGITATLNAQPKAQHFPLITEAKSDFYLLGWGVPTYDSAYLFDYLVHSRTGGYGSWNATGYANPALDAMIEALGHEMDPEVRNNLIAEIWLVVQAETMYLPIHDQVLNWGLKSGIGITLDSSDVPDFKAATLY